MRKREGERKRDRDRERVRESEARLFDQKGFESDIAKKTLELKFVGQLIKFKFQNSFLQKFISFSSWFL